MGSATAPQLLDADLMIRIRDRLTAEPLAPADETIAIRALAAETGVSIRLIVRIWRELSGEARRLTERPPVAVHGGRLFQRTADLARARFGATAPYIGLQTPENALAAARPPGGVAVIALEPDVAWWLRLLAEAHLKVFAALPDLAIHGPRSAFAVAAVETGPTGADETYFVTDAASPSRTVLDALQAAGLVAELVQETGGLKLIALAGYVQAQDPRLDAAPGRLKGVIGASPLPFDL